MINKYLVAIGVALLALFGIKKKQQGESEAELQQAKVVLDNVKKANDSVNDLVNPDEFERVRKKYQTRK